MWRLVSDHDRLRRLEPRRTWLLLKDGETTCYWVGGKAGGCKLIFLECLHLFAEGHHPETGIWIGGILRMLSSAWALLHSPPSPESPPEDHEEGQMLGEGDTDSNYVDPYANDSAPGSGPSPLSPPPSDGLSPPRVVGAVAEGRVEGEAGEEGAAVEEETRPSPDAAGQVSDVCGNWSVKHSPYTDLNAQA